MIAVLKQLEERLNYQFRDLELLKQALTHPSYAAENERVRDDNQRLEFLGDAVLQLVLSEILFHQYSDLREGGLSKARAGLANAESLAGFARELGLGDCLRLGKGEEGGGGRERTSNLADAMEAVLAAIYLEGGLEPVLNLCRRLCQAVLTNPEQMLARENPKGDLQEYTQEHFQLTPDYVVEAVSGPEHSPEFEVSVSIAGRKMASARAGSRKMAEKDAAVLALRKLLASKGELERV